MGIPENVQLQYDVSLRAFIKHQVSDDDSAINDILQDVAVKMRTALAFIKLYDKVSKPLLPIYRICRN